MDEVWKRAEIESPCVKLCVIERDSRLCLGCHRSIDEITAWSRLTPDQRRDIMTDLPNRKPQPAKRRGGRAGRLGAGE